MFLKIREKCPLQTLGESWVAVKLMPNTSDMNDLGLLEAFRTKMGMLIIFSPPTPLIAWANFKLALVLNQGLREQSMG